MGCAVFCANMLVGKVMFRRFSLKTLSTATVWNVYKNLCFRFALRAVFANFAP